MITDEQVIKSLKGFWLTLFGVISKKGFLALAFISILFIYLASHEWAYRAMSGYYDQTAWGAHGVLTNWTIGFALFWPGMGVCIALLTRQYGLRKGWTQEKIKSLIVFNVALIMMVFAYLLSMIGLEGFRF